MASAIDRVLQLPELLERILIEAHQPPYVEVALPSLFRLRAVSKLWRSAIDTSPTLLRITHRNPRLRKDGEDIEVCIPFLYYLSRKEQRVGKEIELNLDNGAVEKYNPAITAFREKMQAEEGAFPSLYITQPAITELALYFSVGPHKKWRKEVPKDPSRKWFGNQCVIRAPEGVMTKHIIDTMTTVISALSKNGRYFKLYEIVMRIGVQEEAVDGDEDGDAGSNYSFEQCEREYVLWPLR